MGLAAGQAVNIWLVAGTLQFKTAYPTLPLRAENCTALFGIKDVNATSGEMNPDVRNYDFYDVYRMSYLVYPIVGFIVTTMVSIFGSVVTGGGKETREEDEELFFPPSWRMFKRRFQSDAASEETPMKCS